MQTTRALRMFSTVCVALGLGSAAAQAQAHTITVADLPIGFATARVVPTPSTGGLLPGGTMTELFFDVQNNSLFGATITGVGYQLPGELQNFVLDSTTSPTFSLSNDVGGVPGLGNATLDFAVLTGATFANGDVDAGIGPGEIVSFSVIGPFPTDFAFERVLDFLVVRFEGAGPAGAQTGVGLGPSAAAVPEPATLILLGAGFAGWGMARRIRARQYRKRSRWDSKPVHG